MAERWQQWMPHDIDAWQGSANVQALSDLAYRAVHNLLQDMWKQADCALPVEDKELAKRSRVAQRWAECRDEVLDYFSDRTEGGKLTHRVLLRKWKEAKEVYEKRQAAAKRTNASRSADGDRSGDRDGDRNAPPTQEHKHIQEQVQEQIQKQKPSRAKREGDPRHEPFRAAIMTYAAYKRVKLPWDESEAKQLALLLKSAPDLTLKDFQACLNNRARSPGTVHGDRPRIWIPNILKYQQGPLTQFNRPEGDHANPIRNRGQEKQDAIRHEVQEAARRLGWSVADADAADAGVLPESNPAAGYP